MDALNLPICDILMTTRELIEIEIKSEQLKFTIHEYLKVNKLIIDNVGAGCWAVTSTILNTGLDVDPTEVLFNNYEEETLSLKKNIMNDVIRDKIIENPYCSLLIHLFRYEKSANIDIYMFKKTPYKIQINYNSNTKEFNVYGYMSEEYKIKYCNDE